MKSRCSIVLIDLFQGCQKSVEVLLSVLALLKKSESLFAKFFIGAKM